jgi:hypothetical protein
MIDLTIELVVLAFAVPVGLLATRRKDPLYLRLFPFFLLITLSVELIGQHFKKAGQNNLILFNLFTVFEFMFYTYFFLVVIPGVTIKKITRIIFWLLPVICFANIFFIQGPDVFHTYTYVVGCLVMVALGITYFYRIFMIPERMNLLREPAFWISVGIIFFFVASVSILGVFNYISTLPRNLIRLLQAIFLWVNAFFYVLFIFAFLCRKNIRKYLPNL